MILSPMSFTQQRFGGGFNHPYDFSGYNTAARYNNMEQDATAAMARGQRSPAFNNYMTQVMQGMTRPPQVQQPTPSQPRGMQTYTTYGGRQVNMPQWWRPGMSVQFRPGASEQRPGWRRAGVVDPNKRRAVAPNGPASPGQPPQQPVQPPPEATGQPGQSVPVPTNYQAGPYQVNTGISPYRRAMGPLFNLRDQTAPSYAGGPIGNGTDSARSNFQQLNKEQFYPAAYNIRDIASNMDAQLGLQRDIAHVQQGLQFGGLGNSRLSTELASQAPFLSFAGATAAAPIQAISGLFRNLLSGINSGGAGDVPGVPNGINPEQLLAAIAPGALGGAGGFG